jgi:acetoin utilization deacetylase AcuC-like enzyme
MTSALVYDESFLRHKTGRHPENPERLSRIIKAVQSDRLLWEGLTMICPSPASENDLSSCHGNALIDHIRQLCQRGEPFVDLDTRISPESFEIARLAAGAAVAGVDSVMAGQEIQNAFALVRPPGHHATPNRAMGFCLFNNAAIAARYAQSRYGVERVLIVDWDVHHGNGTQDIFYGDDTVFYFSTHQYPFYPGTGSRGERGDGRGENYTLNVPLDQGTPARTHREVFGQALASIEKVFPPDFVIISAGFDAHFDDPLGGLLLEDTDFAEMTKEVIGLAERHAEGRIVSILEGGYNLETLGETVRTHIATLSA